MQCQPAPSTGARTHRRQHYRRWAPLCAALLAAPAHAVFFASTNFATRAALLRLAKPHVVAAEPRPALRGVLFDADGTLLDSLPPHIDFLHACNAELGLGLVLPGRSDLHVCRALAAAPMAAFFARAGFPTGRIEECTRMYNRRFGRECPVAPFGGVRELLLALRARDVRCAVVSSNVVGNVRSGLGALAELVDPVIGVDNGPADKADAIPLALRALGLSAAECVYVGDTAKDAAKAESANLRFVGVGYGFEALADALTAPAPVARSVAELTEMLLEAAGPGPEAECIHSIAGIKKVCH